MNICFFFQKNAHLFNLSIWNEIISRAKSNIKNKITPTSRYKSEIRKWIRKKYLCNLLNDELVDKLLRADYGHSHSQVRDELMSKKIHQLLKKSKKDRYFFVIGAGI